MIKKLLRWLPAVLYMILIFYLSSYPAPPPAKAMPIYFDIKLIHIIEYGVLSALIFFGLNRATKIPLAWQIIYSITLTYMYGLTDEFHQIFVVGRSASLIDTIANFVGASLFQALIFFFMRGKRSSFNS